MIPYDALANDYLVSLTGRGLSEATKRREGYALARFGRWLSGKDVREMTASRFDLYAGFLGQVVSKRNRPLSPRSVAIELETVARFFDYLYRNDLLLTNPLENYTTGKTAGEQRKIFSEEEISLFLDCIPLSEPEGMRDRAFFELAYSSGFRLGELCALTLNCLYLDERVCLVKQGKGKKDRYVPFSKTALVFVLKYLEEGRKVHEKRLASDDLKAYVFLGPNGKVKHAFMRDRFNDHLEECGLGGRGFTIHSIRHACATHLLSHGASIRYVQELLGHESLNTTQIYARPGEWDVRKMYRTYHPRENEYYLEPDEEYLSQMKKLIVEREAAREFQRKRTKRL